MQSKFIDEPITYDGSQLQSHWILRNTELRGDAVVSFIGPCRVELDKMVDLEDVLQKKQIFSESMLHFIIECFDADLEKMILRQRLLISQIQQELAGSVADKIVRKGDDLFIDHFKLTVSIATVSPVSTLVHTGINVSSRNTPVPTKGLADFNLNPQAFARSVMNRVVEEMEGVWWARCKVRSVT